jgi:hypothetical protein
VGSIDWVIYGRGLSALVLAERLGSVGLQVLLLNPDKSWGGIFRGINIDGDVFDAGMTNFEFDLFGEPAQDLQHYCPDRKSDIGRYVHFAQRYLERFVETVPLPTPVMQFRGKVVEDLILSNRFEVFRSLAPEVRISIRDELEAILAVDNPLHPRTKNSAESRLMVTPFEDVSRANHGKTLHELFIEPMFRKVLGIPTAEIEGVFHRNGWVPLFYPETLLSQFWGSKMRLAPTVFRYPNDDNFGAFIDRILKVVQDLPNVRMVESVRDIEINLASATINTCDEKISFRRLAWDGNLNPLIGSSSKPPQPGRRASLDLFFLKVQEWGVANRFAVLVDPEVESPFYRITNQTICSGSEESHHKIILECNSCNWSEEGRDQYDILSSALRRYAIDPESVVTWCRRRFTGALAIPSYAQMNEFNYQRDYIAQRFHNIELIGASSGYISVTLNDHIIQALKVAQKEGALQ